MAKKQRKPRDKFNKTLDVSKPLPLDIIGTADDPCFGKLYDPQTKECQRCGDSEICATLMGQANHLLRSMVEEKQSFKDIEEVDIKPNPDKKQVRKDVKNHIRRMVKEAGKEGTHIDNVVNEVFAVFGKDGYSKKRARIVINKILDNSARIKLKLKNLVWKFPKP